MLLPLPSTRAPASSSPALPPQPHLAPPPRPPLPPPPPPLPLLLPTPPQRKRSLKPQRVPTKRSARDAYNARLYSLCEEYRRKPGSPGLYWFVTPEDKRALGKLLCPANPRRGARSVGNWYANRRKADRRSRLPGGGGACVRLPPGRPSAAAVERALAKTAAAAEAVPPAWAAGGGGGADDQGGRVRW